MLFWTGCFLITAQDIAEHDRALQSPAPEPPVPEPAPTSPPPDPPSGDSPEEALLIEAPLSASRLCEPAELESPGDIDWYRFTGAAPGDILAVSTAAATAEPPSPLDTVLTSEAGRVSNDSMYGKALTDSVLMVEPGEAVQVSELVGAGGHPYEVCAQIVPLVDAEPNDSPSQANGVVPDTNAVQLVGGWWDGSPDVYELSLRPDRVYRASMLPGHPLGALRLLRLQPDAASVVQAADEPDYDDRPWALGYPPDAGLMFREPLGTAWLAVEGGPQHGPYVLAIQELEQNAFPSELEPNDQVSDAQPIPLFLQQDGTYRSELQGSLSSLDLQDLLLLEPPAPSWGDLQLDLVLQSASVGGNQDLAMALYDPFTGQSLGVAEADPAGLLDPDPVMLSFAPGDLGRIALGLGMQTDLDEIADQWFLTIRAHP